MRCWLEVVLLCILLPVTYSAYCGTSAIPYSLEVLPDGSTVLGCARPACFGWEPITGTPAAFDESFQTVNGRPDGFLRQGNDRVQPFLQQAQQTAICMSSNFAGCMVDQWSAGIYRQSTGALSLTCCSYPPLVLSQDRGVAALHPGEIFIGGEMDNNSTFDYIQNVTEIYGESGQITGYNVHVRRISCSTPLPAPQPQAAVEQLQPSGAQQVYQPSQGYYYPAGGYASAMQCFAADSKVRLQDGREIRMDELTLDQWLKSPNWNTQVMINVPMTNWLHRMPEEEAEFLQITTRLGKTIKITPKHYIYRASCDPSKHSIEQILAEELREEECVMQEIPGTDTLYPTPVDSIKIIKQKGIYAPLSDKGSLMVDGIAVSCYSEADDNTIIQTAMKTFMTCDHTDDSLHCYFQKSTVSLLLDVMKLVVPPTSIFNLI